MTRFRAYSSDSGTEDEEEEEDLPQEVSVAAKVLTRVTADVEDEDEDSESEESEASSASESSGSEMQDDELVQSPPRRRKNSKNNDRNALVEDENGDIRYAHEVDIRVSPASTSSRVFPGTRTRPEARGDPAIIPWAQRVGVDAQKMHVMQTSLFRMPEEAAALRAMNQPLKGKGPAIRLDLDPKAQSVNRKHSRDSEGDGLRLDSRERASFAHDIDPPILHPFRKYARVEVTSSVADGSDGAYFDAGLALGRSFRVGWGPGGQLVHLGSICNPSSTSHTSSNSSVVTITKSLPALSLSPPEATTTSQPVSPAPLAAKLLQHHLTYSTIFRDENGVPCAYPATSSAPSSPASARATMATAATSPDPLNFASFASLFPSTDTSSPAPIFRLGSALFDPIDLHLGRARSNNITPDIRHRANMLRRKTALSRWLEDVVKPTVDGDLRVQTSGSNAKYTAADAAFTHLTGHQISAACTKAADGGYLKLATLISQAGGDDRQRQDILSQLDIWKEEKLSPGSNSALTGPQNGLVGIGVWRVYTLLAGLLEPDDESSRPEERICVGLDWKRVFGLTLWYGTGVDASVADVVKSYEHILLHNSSRASSNELARPIPKWAVDQKKRPQQPSLGTSRLGLYLGAGTRDSRPEDQPEDPLFVLIKLHADPTLSLSKALNPLSFSPSGLDWGIAMCWHLYIIISRVMRVRDFADRADPGVRTTRSSKTTRTGLVNGVGGGHGPRRGESSSDNQSRDGGDDDEPQPEGHSPTADLLASSYAFELENWGMLQEAAFVLLHLEGSLGREKAIKDLLARSGPKLNDWMIRGLVGSLKLPMIWIDEAKAMHELDCGNIYSAYELYISAQVYNAAHNIAVLELAPDAVIRKDLELLRNLFSPLDMSGRREKIDGWFVRGQIFLDYVTIMTRLPQLLDSVAADNEDDEAYPDASQSEEIDDLTKRIPKIIGLLPDILHRKRTADDRHAAALEEMTKDLLKLVERARPLLLSQIQQPRSTVLDGAARINLVKGIGYARFLQSIEA